MAATDPHEAPDPPVVATDAPRRVPLLDPFVCGIREIEDPPAALPVPPVRLDGLREA